MWWKTFQLCCVLQQQWYESNLSTTAMFALKTKYRGWIVTARWIIVTYKLLGLVNVPQLIMKISAPASIHGLSSLLFNNLVSSTLSIRSSSRLLDAMCVDLSAFLMLFRVSFKQFEVYLLFCDLLLLFFSSETILKEMINHYNLQIFL